MIEGGQIWWDRLSPFSQVSLWPPHSWVSIFCFSWFALGLAFAAKESWTTHTWYLPFSLDLTDTKCQHMHSLPQFLTLLPSLQWIISIVNIKGTRPKEYTASKELCWDLNADFDSKSNSGFKFSLLWFTENFFYIFQKCTHLVKVSHMKLQILDFLILKMVISYSSIFMYNITETKNNETNLPLLCIIYCNT